MEPSEEMCRLVHRWLQANAEGDAGAVLERISEHPGMPGRKIQFLESRDLELKGLDGSHQFYAVAPD